MTKIVQRSTHKLNLMVTGLAITGLVSLAILAVASGLLPSSPVDINPAVVALFAIILLSSSYFIYLLTKKLNDKSPGLVISNDGITYSMSPIGKAIGTVAWADIKQLKETEDIIISVIVRNPELYIGRIKNGYLKKKVQQLANQPKRPNVVLLISANGLNCDYDELKLWLVKGLEDYKDLKNS